MQRALSLKSEKEQTSTAQPGTASGFEIRPYNASDPEDEIGATIDAANLPQSSGSCPLAGSEDYGDDSGLAAEDHFTTIEEARLEEKKAERSGHPLISAPTWFLAVALLITALIGWYVLQPPTAESLYGKIRLAAQQDRLLDVKEEVQQFLEYYNQDPRAKMVARYQDAIEGIQLKERAGLQARVLNKKYRNSPIGPEYSAALELATTDPELAAQRLAALITLYRPLANNELIGPFVRAAENQLPYVKQRAKERIAVERQLITGRLDVAREAREHNPEKTKSICLAICTLYRDRPWAKALVDQAEQLLAGEVHPVINTPLDLDASQAPLSQ